MKKWIIASVALLLIGSHSVAEHTIRYIEDGVRKARVVRDPEDDAPVSYYAAVKPGENDKKPKREFDISTTNGVTSITDRNTGRTVFCTPNLPHKDSYSCR